MANPNGQDPNAQQEPIYGMVHGARLFEEPDEPQDDDWGQVVNHDWGTAREQKPAKEGAEDQQGSGNDALVGELKGQVAALQKQLEQMQMASVYQSPQQAPQQQQQQQDPGPQLEELPDPYEDPKAYADVVARNTRAQIMWEQQKGVQRQQTQNAHEQKYGELWQDFQMKHKDYAENFDQVQFAANKVAQKAIKRGWDIERYMFVHRDQFMDDVVQEMESIFGPKGQKAEQQQQQPFQPAHGAQMQQQQGPEPTHRTNGMFGGMNTGGRPSLGGAEEEVSDPFTDIREFQKQTGFYR